MLRSGAMGRTSTEVTPACHRLTAAQPTALLSREKGFCPFEQHFVPHQLFIWCVFLQLGTAEADTATP